MSITEDVLRKRYFLKDESGKVVEDWEGLCTRVAGAVSQNEKECKDFYEVLHERLFLPNTPALTNAGKEKFSMSACFVLPVEDSMEGIFEAVKQAALIHKSGGGTGFSFSRLRPNGDMVGSTKGVASGPCSFIRVFDTATDVTKQGGTRRGANMGILRVDHPDIMEFITLKKEEGKLSNFNLSVGITDKFMKALKEGGDFDLVFNGRVRRTVKAKEIWDAIVDGAWENGEPGVVFLDVINRDNTVPHIGQIEATNPCVTGDTLVAAPNGEQIPAYSFTTGDEIVTAHGTVEKVKQIEIYPDMDVYKVTFSDGGTIKVTLAHQFYARNRYSANEDFTPIALEDLYTGDVVKKFKGPAVRIISIIHAGKAAVYDLYEPSTDTWITNGYVSRGCGEQPLLPYEACVLGSINLSKMLLNGEIDWGKLDHTIRAAVRFLDNIIDVQYYPIPEIERMHKANRKIGLGIIGWADMLIKLEIPYNSDKAIKLAEKVMSFITNASVKESEALAEEKGVFPNWEGSVWHKKDIRLRNATTTTIAPTGSISLIAGSSSGIEPIFDFVTIQKRPIGEHKVIHPLYEEWVRNNGDKPLPPYFVTAKEIPYQWHIKMQAAFQRHTHNAISKTINLPNNSTKEDIASAFLTAYELGCKGVTVYRDGSRQKQVISSAKVAKADSDDLPPVMDAKRVCIDTSEGKVYVNVSLSAANDPVEVFITTPVESRFAEVYESFGRIFSVALRNGTPVKKLLSQLEKANGKYGSVSSIPAAIIRAFRMLGINGGPGESCPDCGSILILQEGCIKCITCGYTKC